MNRVIKALYAALCAMLLVSSCASDGVKVKKDTAEYETDEMIVKCDTAEFSGTGNAELEAYLNERYACDLSDISEKLAAADKRERVNGEKYSYTGVIETAGNDRDILSVVKEEYIYTGGAHGTLTRTAENIYIPSGETFVLSNMFSDTDYAEVLERKMSETAARYPDEYSELWEKPSVGEKEEENFYIEGDKLVIFYQPYELSYYARGVVEFPIDMKDIAGYLKEDFKPQKTP